MSAPSSSQDATCSHIKKTAVHLMVCRKLVSAIKMSFAIDLSWSKCGKYFISLDSGQTCDSELLQNEQQKKNLCVSTGNCLFEIQKLVRHTNENVNTDLHSAKIIINHCTVSLVTTGRFTDIRPRHKADPPAPPTTPSYLQSSLSISKCGLKLRTIRCDGSGAVMIQWQFW